MSEKNNNNSSWYCGSVYKTIKNLKNKHKKEHKPSKTKIYPKKPNIFKNKNRKIMPKRSSSLSIRTNNTLTINTNIPYKPPKSFSSI
jgi:hypothetical protein